MVSKETCLVRNIGIRRGSMVFILFISFFASKRMGWCSTFIPLCIYLLGVEESLLLTQKERKLFCFD